MGSAARDPPGAGGSQKAPQFTSYGFIVDMLLKKHTAGIVSCEDQVEVLVSFYIFFKIRFFQRFIFLFPEMLPFSRWRRESGRSPHGGGQWLNLTKEHLFTHHLTTHPLVSANHANEVVSTPSTLDVRSLCNNGAPGPNAFAFLANDHPDFCFPQTASKEHLSAHLLAKVRFCQGPDSTTWHPSLSKTF